MNCSERMQAVYGESTALVLVQGCMSDPQLRSVGVLAAWCETETHLLDPPVEELLSENQQLKNLCVFLVESGWDPSEPLPAAVRSQLESRAHQGRSGRNNQGNTSDASHTQPRLTTAEISQRSVDLLLREYYKMVQAQRAARHTADGSGGMLQSLFLLLCPATPACCDLRHIAAAATCLTRTGATLVVLLACIMVPAWLAVIRELMLQQQIVQAAAIILGGLIAMLLADVIHRHAAAQRRATAAAAVTPASVQQLLLSVGPTTELATLRQASKTVTTSNNNNKHSFGQQQLQQLQQQHATQAGSPLPTPAAGVSGSGPSYLSLLPALAALQSALGVSSSEPPTSRERLADELSKVCGVLGVAVTPDMLASPGGMANTISQLKTHIGI